MKAMILNNICDLNKESEPLELVYMSRPKPVKNEVLIKISACGVCHTELDEIEGRTPPVRFPVIPGHQVVGEVIQTGLDVLTRKEGDRVGVGWIWSSCGICKYCISGNDNLCSEFVATGRDKHGGYAEYMVVPEDYTFIIPSVFSDTEAAPLLCAGAIGYRSLKLAGLNNNIKLGLTGFGSSAHLVLKMIRAKYPEIRTYVFARSEKEREFAIDLGACWAGKTEESSPEKLHAIIDTTPVWKPVVESMKNLLPGGRLVINAIRKENIDKDELLKLSYNDHLWMEKEIKTVANVSKSDIREFLKLAAEIPIKPAIKEFNLEIANQALMELKNRKIRGAKVLKI